MIKIGNGVAYNDDCFNIMPNIPTGSIDMILADLPYGTTSLHWDKVIPLQAMWNEFVNQMLL